jgi:hypothetical protein
MQMEPLAELQIADSRFLGFAFNITRKDDALKWQSQLRARYSDAAHVPVIWKLAADAKNDGCDEDGEPLHSVQLGCLLLVPSGLAVVIVRYFGTELLGVTCGRLPQCYQSIVRLTVHRFLHGNTPMILDIPKATTTNDNNNGNVYGMAAGDCELILNVVEDAGSSPSLVSKVLQELDFGGFRGAAGEVLPRLQNLQADLSENIIPVYRYPGNYNGQEWATYPWAPTSLQIKKAVEEALQPLVHQTMNHCVTNYYRDGNDFIAHHSDKDLDLNREGVIVSVSLGDERILELRRRQEPQDITRIALPHGSMLVLGPRTNQLFSHSILPKPESTDPRVSLTLRDVRTFLDLATGRLFGQGVDAKSLDEIRQRYMIENVAWLGGFGALSAWLVGTTSKRKSNSSILSSTLMTTALAISFFSARYWSNLRYHKREEQAARSFFSKTSMSGTKY